MKFRISTQPALRLEDIGKAIIELQTYGWIRCSVSMPKEGITVLVTDGTNIYMAKCFKGEWFWQWHSPEDYHEYPGIIAWRPRPAIPEILIEKCKSEKEL